MSSESAVPTPGVVATVGAFTVESASSADHATGQPLAEIAQSTIDSFEARQKGEPEPAAAVAPAPAAPKAPAAEPSDDETAPGATPPKKGSMRWRHDELRARVHAATREFHDVRGRLDATRAEIAAAEAKLAALKAQPAASPTPKPALTPPVALPDNPDDPQPAWDGEGGYDSAGKTFSEFTKDHTAWLARNVAATVRTEILSEQEQREKTAADARAAADADARNRDADAASRARVQAIVQDLSAKDPDVAAALQSDEFLDMPQTPFMGALIKLHPAGADVLSHLAQNTHDGYAFASLDMTPAIMEAFKNTNDPVRLLTALANNLPEAQRIARLSPYQALKALAALESSPSGAKSGTADETPRQPHASPLPAKVGGRSAANVSSLADLTASTDNFDEYARRRLAGEDLHT